MDRHRLSTLVATVVVLTALGVVWDMVRRATRHRPPDPQRVAAETPQGPAYEPPGPPAPPLPAPGAESQGLQPPEREPSNMELAARAQARRQIRASAGLTYLNEILAASADSVLHRWDNRVRWPVRVHVAAGGAPDYQPAFLDAVRDAVRIWEGVVPVRFDLIADSVTAEVRFFWTAQFDIDRTGQTDLVWNESGHIQSGVVTLATHDPKGQRMGPADMRLVALHELGHVVGLDHSPDSTDVMFPVATARQLSRRDIETAQFLYRLAPGSIR
jgi:matrixin